jgi:3-methyladenine DNA glycosylase/8-oxoguanine DNA glycosylase
MLMADFPLSAMPQQLSGKRARRKFCAEGDAREMADYFNLHVNLTAKARAWAAADKRYSQIAPYIYGARMLRQHPVECLFEFICSSNNHISRIGGMVEHLCQAYGTPLELEEGALQSCHMVPAALR